MLNARLEMDIRKFYFSKIIEKGYKFFLKFRTGDLVTRLTDDIGGWPKIAWFMCSGIFRAVESGSKFLFCVAFMLMMNWRLTLLAVAPLPVMLYLFYIVRIELGRRARERQNIISKTNDALEAAFSGVRIVKGFNAEQNQSREFRRLLERRIGVELAVTKLWMAVWNIYWAIEFIGQIIVISAGGMMVINGTLTVGELYAFYVYLSLLFQPLIDIPNLFVTARQAFASIDREIEIEETPGGTEGIYVGQEPVKVIESIKLDGVKFTYDENLSPALEEINLELRRGEKIAFVGLVGSGKSTILKVLAGLLPTKEGEVLVNGRPLSQLSLSDYRARVGYIPQEATLFSETVRENVKFGREIEERDLLRALELAQVRAEMESLPKGYDQVLGQRGLTVSGGQKQRLAIARAIAGKPQVLLMDDCTASLDSENERRFWEMLKDAYPDTACVIVTHRISTARQADVIYVMEKGRVVGKGSHEELLRTCELYRNFLSREELEAEPAVRLAKAG